jgi:hypothetical protein
MSVAGLELLAGDADNQKKSDIAFAALDAREPQRPGEEESRVRAIVER